jgi:hypothetical protein
MAPSTTEGEDGDVANGFVGNVGVTLAVALTGVSAAGSVGTVTHGGAVVDITGSAATGNVEAVGHNHLIALTGVNATGSAGDVIAVYWKPIDDTQTPSWQNISNPQTPGWSDVSNEQTVTWEEVVT